MNSFWWGSKGGGTHGINWLSWDKLSICKAQGGVGFRNLYAFNLALLSKQAWRLMSQPQSIVARLLKAKYYPNCDFLNAPLGGNPSYVWRSIWNAKLLVKEGSRWCIGNGKNIRVWDDLWIGDGRWLTIQPQHLLIPELCVGDLMLDGSKQRNPGLVHNLFGPDEAAAILNVPLFDAVKEDKLVWGLSNDGRFSVKSAYNLCMNRIVDTSHLVVEGSWMDLWKLEVPPKVKGFLWKVCRDVLPVRTKLQSRGVPCSAQCPLCESDVETCWHLFIECPKSLECWRLSKLDRVVSNWSQTGGNLKDHLFQVLLSQDPRNRAAIAMNMWSIWLSRNSKVWEGKAESAANVVYRASSTLEAWCSARDLNVSSQNSADAQVVASSPAAIPQPWTKPVAGYIKCNVDAAFSRVRNSVGIGMVVRDEFGHFVKAQSISRHPLLPVRLDYMKQSGGLVNKIGGI